MRIFSLIVMLCILVQANVSAQNAEAIAVSKKGSLNFTSYTGRVLSFKQVKQQVNTVNDPSFDVLQTAQTGRTIAGALSFAGGALIGFPVGQALVGGKPQWVLLGAGVALVGISIPIEIAANNKARGAVSVYNEGVGAVAANRIKPQCIVGFTGNGVGLTLKF